MAIIKKHKFSVKKEGSFKTTTFENGRKVTVPIKADSSIFSPGGRAALLIAIGLLKDKRQRR